MRIAIDLNGGDKAPVAILEGLQLAYDAGLEAEAVLYGDKNLLERHLMDDKTYRYRAEIVHCDEFIEDRDKPVAAIRKKKNSSMVRAANDLREGRVDAFLSAGNTGALLASATLITGRIKKIKRPALTTIYPTEKGFAILCDVGANASVNARSLADFALMGSLYSKLVLGVDEPRVALLNIGAEETKGTELYQEAHEVLKTLPGIDFAGNLEARDLLKGLVDVVVCDGFTGNIALKLMEGVAASLFAQIKKHIMASKKAKMGALLLKSTFADVKGSLDASNYGGAPLLGIKAPVIKAHGSSNALAFKNALLYAEKYAKSNLIENLEREVLRTGFAKRDTGEEMEVKED